jgi:ERCC4-type nuclease
MAEGDYTTERLQGVAAIERSRAGELAGKMTYARERVDDEVRRLMNYWRRCLVVEGEIGEVSRSSAIHPNSVIGSIASWYARSDMPVLFAGTAQGAGRLIAGVLKRWEERLAAEGSAGK